MEIRRFNWTRKLSTWQTVQVNKLKNQYMVSKFADASAIAANAFLGAQNNLNTGLATITAQRLIARSQAELKASADALSKSKTDLLA